MTNTPSDIVPFGTKYFYSHSTRTIIALGPPERRIEFSAFTTLQGSRHQFSDSELAVEIFDDELESATFPVLADLRPGWVAVQVSLPFLELIGKIMDGLPVDNQNFKAGARRVVPKRAITPLPDDATYELIIGTLWVGLRCGLSHTGFLQDEPNNHIDVQVRGGNNASLLTYSGSPEDMVVEVGAKKFVDATINALRTVIADLRADRTAREQKFLPLWQRRWGSYPL